MRNSISLSIATGLSCVVVGFFAYQNCARVSFDQTTPVSAATASSSFSLIATGGDLSAPSTDFTAHTGQTYDLKISGSSDNVSSGLNNSESFLKKISGQCSGNSIYQPFTLDLTQSGAQFVFGDNNWNYSSHIADQIGGCTWQVCASTNGGQQACVTLNALANAVTTTTVVTVTTLPPTTSTSTTSTMVTTTTARPVVTTTTSLPSTTTTTVAAVTTTTPSVVTTTLPPTTTLPAVVCASVSNPFTYVDYTACSTGPNVPPGVPNCVTNSFATFNVHGPNYPNTNVSLNVHLQFAGKDVHCTYSSYLTTSSTSAVSGSCSPSNLGIVANSVNFFNTSSGTTGGINILGPGPGYGKCP